MSLVPTATVLEKNCATPVLAYNPLINPSKRSDTHTQLPSPKRYQRTRLSSAHCLTFPDGSPVILNWCVCGLTWYVLTCRLAMITLLVTAPFPNGASASLPHSPLFCVCCTLVTKYKSRTGMDEVALRAKRIIHTRSSDVPITAVTAVRRAATGNKKIMKGNISHLARVQTHGKALDWRRSLNFFFLTLHMIDSSHLIHAQSNGGHYTCIYCTSIHLPLCSGATR